MVQDNYYGRADGRYGTATFARHVHHNTPQAEQEYLFQHLLEGLTGSIFPAV